MLLCGIAPLGAQIGSAPTGGGPQVAPPPGWVQIEPEAGVVGRVFVPHDAHGDRLCALMLLPEEEIAGDFREWFEVNWRLLTAGRDPVAGGEIESVNGAGGETLRAEASLLGEAGDAAHVILQATRRAGRVETLLFLADEDLLYRRYREGALAFMAARSGAPDRARAVAPSAGRPGPTSDPGGPGAGGGFHGLYVGLDAGAGFDAGVRANHLVFFPDGTVLWHFPEQGLWGFDAARHRAEQPDLWGAWERSAGAVEIAWSWGARDVAVMRSEDALTFRGDHHERRRSCDGLRLAGVYGRAYPGDDAEPRIAFAPDGTFQDGGILAVVGIVDLQTGRPIVPSDPGRGRYACASNTLELAYEDGRVARLSFYDLGGAGSPDAVVMHGYGLSRLR